jgi:peptidoglycan-N-acetylglucosamine deacetylase
MGEGGDQTTRLKMLEELMQYAADPANGIWLAPVGVVGEYVMSKR